MRTFPALFLSTLLLVLFSFVAPGDPPPAHAQSPASFRAEYFDNVDLSGLPVMQRDDPAINFNWGAGSPGPNLPADGFSVRWTRWLDADTSGLYTFQLASDDGSRLWVDGDLVVDMWYDHAPLTRTRALDLTTGYHLLRVDYYDRDGSALVTLNITPPSANSDWEGEYFDNKELQGTPVLTNSSPELDFNWPAGSPDAKVPTAFSARWSRDQFFEAGSYRFTAMTDDGMRVWVGSTLLIDRWHDQAPTTYTADIDLSAGVHPLRVEYYNASGNGTARLSWAPSPASGSSWSGQYFNNSNLSGNPFVSRKSADLDISWGTNGPGAGLSGSAFSAKFDSTRNTPAAGFYTVYARADDGVRVSVDGKLLIDEWRDQAPATFGATVYLTAGPHQWHVEYYQHLGSASLSVQIVNGVSSPPGDGRSDIVVEDGGDGWLAGGNGAEWRTVPNGSGGRALVLGNSAFFLPSSRWGRWYPSLLQAR
ncbi:MAG: PA14 domain-containing protein, partial [Rudaea sp.]